MRSRTHPALPEILQKLNSNPPFYRPRRPCDRHGRIWICRIPRPQMGRAIGWTACHQTRGIERTAAEGNCCSGAEWSLNCVDGRGYNILWCSCNQCGAYCAYPFWLQDKADPHTNLLFNPETRAAIYDFVYLIWGSKNDRQTLETFFLLRVIRYWDILALTNMIPMQVLISTRILTQKPPVSVTFLPFGHFPSFPPNSRPFS